ncbi:pentapeptide repeat-containing protein [Nocardioides ferulae]|uniref:pentapeptide repeat-containing protein n=1 Tax=Nocardioides ferulae TaxID=2340821 RepID=UPI001F0BDEFF|nr:pentapeptide repeat-containing protein [Nocardioides ferulae]
MHDQLNDIGMRGCTIFECFGAGQQVTQVTYAGEGLGADPERDRQRFAVFAVLRAVHEMRWLLAEAPRLPPAGAEESRAWQRRLAELAQAAPETVLSTDLAAIRSAVGELLRTASRGARSRRGADLAGADLLGADLRARDLRDADLRGALLVAADLRGSDLTNADLLGADLRDADLRAADASRALFLTQPQVNATRGDGATRLPSALDRPVGWT